MTRPTTPKTTAAKGSPRRHVAWLLLGWLAFWLASASPACELLIDGKRSGQSAPATLGFAVPHSSIQRSHDPATGGVHCPDVSAVSVATLFAATPQDDGVDTVSFLATGHDTLTVRRFGWSRHFLPGASPPLSRLPLYLRTARLLI